MTEGTSKRALMSKYGRGTSSYRAPELIAEQTYNNKVDIFAMGCILYELIFQQKAFSGDIEVHIYSIEQKSISLPFDTTGETFSEDDREAFSNIIQQMLDVDPKKRPQASTLSQWFRNVYKVRKLPSKTKLASNAWILISGNSSSCYQYHHEISKHYVKCLTLFSACSAHGNCHYVRNIDLQSPNSISNSGG